MACLQQAKSNALMKKPFFPLIYWVWLKVDSYFVDYSLLCSLLSYSLIVPFTGSFDYLIGALFDSPKREVFYLIDYLMRDSTGYLLGSLVDYLKVCLTGYLIGRFGLFRSGS